MLIHQFLEHSAVQFPTDTAIVHAEDRITYQQLDIFSQRLACYLQANGITKGSRIAILLENSIDYVIAYYAVLKSGAVAAPLNSGLKPDGLKSLLWNLEPAAIIASYKSERLLKAVDLDALQLKILLIRTPKLKWDNVSYEVSTFEEGLKTQNQDLVRDKISETDLASIIYTSGSTGSQKGVMLSHKNIVSNTKSICSYLQLTHKDVQMVVLPFFYVMGKSLLNTHVAVGGKIVINNRFMYPADVVNQMIEENVTGFSGVPSTYAYLLHRSPFSKCKDKLVSLRYCSQAGGHMALYLKKELRKALPGRTKIYVMYGATEGAARLTYLEPKYFESKIDSIGKPIPGVDIKLLNKDNIEVTNGEEGELVAYGPNIMLGYWKDPQESSRVLRNDGYHTGDIGYRDSEGFLYLKRRKDDLLKVGGHRVNPIDVEDFMLSTELLVEVAVVGLPDKFLGNKLIALAVPKDNTCSSKTIMEKCAAGLPNYKVPAESIIIRSLPKNANGKIDRNKCVQLAENYKPAQTNT